MDRAWKSGASATPPAAPATPSIGHPSAGNPSLGVPATKPGEYWYHMITEELRALVVAGGLTPNPGALNQVLLSLQALFAPAGSTLTTSSFTGSNQSLGSSGYQKLPGGLIVQWGSTPATPVQSTSAVTFPLAFPTAAYSVVLGEKLPTPSNALPTAVDSLTVTGFTHLNPNTIGAIGSFYIAIGR